MRICVLKHQLAALTSSIFLLLGAAAAQAQSFCGETDADMILAALVGEWEMRGGTSVEGVNVSVTEATIGHAVLDDQARFSSREVLASEPMPLAYIDGFSPTLLPVEQVYDVDGVDNILETVDAEWIADDLSTTPCGPEGLVQFNLPVEASADLVAGVTLIPYFADKILWISEAK